MSETPRSTRILMTPGPVQTFSGLRGALEPLHHRSDEFRAVVRDVEGMLRELARSSGNAYVLTSSGTGAMEAAIANVTVPGSRVLVVSGGKFGERWAEICRAYECRTDVMHFDGGHAIDVDSVARRVHDDRPEFVALTHVESSTGLRAPIREIASRLGKRRPVLIVDAISSLGAEELSMDEWGIDVAVAASQKSLAAPSGIGFILMGEKARSLMGKRSGLYYFDLARYEAGRMHGDTPFTPAVETVQIVHRALTVLKEAGYENVIRRHARASAALLRAAEHLSLRSYPENPSAAVQVLRLAEISRGSDVLARLAREGFIAADGQGDLKGKILRTGFLGLFEVGTLEHFVTALGRVLAESGCRVDGPAATRCIREGGIDGSGGPPGNGIFSGFDA